MKKRKLCLHANRAGFASMYGTWIFAIILLFLSLFTLRLSTYVGIRKQTSDTQDIFILHTMSQELKNRKKESDKTEQTSKELTPNTDDAQSKDNEKPIQETDFAFEKKNAACTYLFQKQEKIVNVSSPCMLKRMQIFLSEDETAILYYEYVS